jgi:hypothetical protein
MALTSRPEQLSGTIERLHANGHTGSIMSDDGQRYFFPRQNLARFGWLPVTWDQIRVGMRCRFTPAVSDRAKDDPRALEVVITDQELDGI